MRFRTSRSSTTSGTTRTGTAASNRTRSISLPVSRACDNVDPADPGSSAQVNQVSKNLKTPTTDEVIVGVERQIFSDLSGSVAYTYRTSRNLTFTPLVGTTRESYQYLGNATGTATGADGFVLNFSEPYYGLTTCPDPCSGVVLENRPDASETYSGVELQFLKSLSHGWMARVSFAYNDWQQHIGPGAIVNPNNEVPGTNATGPVVESGINATWQFNVSGMVELPLGIAAGVNLFGRQGFPTLYSVEVDRRRPTSRATSSPFRSDPRRATELQTSTSSICSCRRSFGSDRPSR